MRFQASSLLLALALSFLPSSSGRVVPNSLSTFELNEPEHVHQSKRAPVFPSRPGQVSASNRLGASAVQPLRAAQPINGLTPNPLAAQRQPAAANRLSPAANRQSPGTLGQSNTAKLGNTPALGPSNARLNPNSRLGGPANGPLTPCDPKRARFGRIGRRGGDSCSVGSSSDPTLSAAEAASLQQLGTQALALAAAPKPWDVNFAARLSNYDIRPSTDTTLAQKITQAIRLLQLGTAAQSGFQSFDIVSVSANGPQAAEPVAKASFGCVDSSCGTFVASIAHERFAVNDANRFKMGPDGKAIKGADKKPVKTGADTWMPVSQLIFEAMKQSGQLAAAQRILLISDTIINDLADKAINTAHAAVGMPGQVAVFRADAVAQAKARPNTPPVAGASKKDQRKGTKNSQVKTEKGVQEAQVEQAQFVLLAGVDNNRSYLDTVGRNPDPFAAFKVVSIRSIPQIDEPRTLPMMAIELVRG